MANKKHKSLRIQLEALTRPQLVALAVQKDVLTYQGACDTASEKLVEMFMEVEGILKPQRTNGVVPEELKDVVEEETEEVEA